MLLAGFEANRGPRSHLDDLASGCLNARQTVQHVQDLAEPMGVPRRPRARGEVDEQRTGAARLGLLTHCLRRHRPGEPSAGPGTVLKRSGVVTSMTGSRMAGRRWLRGAVGGRARSAAHGRSPSDRSRQARRRPGRRFRAAVLGLGRLGGGGRGGGGSGRGRRPRRAAGSRAWRGAWPRRRPARPRRRGLGAAASDLAAGRGAWPRRRAGLGGGRSAWRPGGLRHAPRRFGRGRLGRLGHRALAVAGATAGRLSLRR